MNMLSFASRISFLLLMLLCALTFHRSFSCHDRDRTLLLMFKQGVVDPSGRLSSWSSTNQDCCSWQGVTCDLDTSRVRYLLLSNYFTQNESLRGEINLSSLLALEFLEALDLHYNDFERLSTPSLNNSAANFSRLSSLGLSYNMHLPIDNLHWLSKLPSLTSLALGGIHLPSETKWLDLGLNDFTYGLPNWLFNLSKDLSYLQLDHCNLRGPIPDFSSYRNLWALDLSDNKLEGPIPDWLGQFEKLFVLDLSVNSFHGSIPSNLVNASQIEYLNISFNDLSGTLPKNLDKRQFATLDLSHHSISGDISNMLLDGGYISMSFKKFKGRLPRVSNQVSVLDLAYNSFSGSLSSLLCHPDPINQHWLGYLDISNNYLAEELPECLGSWTSLSYIYLGNNRMVGQVPPRMGSSFYHLKVLDLHNNKFSGHVPWTFHNCTYLVLINLEGNHFSGSMLTWLPQNVSVVKLRSNQLTGTIPPQLCSHSSLIVLDLANNKLSGPIPQCLLNITSMITGVLANALTIEGQQLEYVKNLKLVRSFDLSANRLSGEIPAQLFKLTKLQSLNLSYNYLTGEISEHIGDMKNLESLDFSHNSLHGNIPQSMAGLSFLSDLNLSYNHLNGQIPLGTQLQSFDAWSYIGNPDLCGAPLQKNCTIPEKPDNTKQVEGNDEDAFLRSLYLGMGVGFAVGSWIVCGSLFLNRAWRHAYFQFFNGVVDRIYVTVVIRLQRFR
ncbi:receptor-like protein EIX2 [Prosopis cineraria]|uniref:receptor-like protein EIX2 n=1 Tax=Prosopis cineraria TaxID=364024 RepID=UPI00240F5DB0|nr:receptor-like protein EIX2 [Prosopis cineraria]